MIKRLYGAALGVALAFVGLGVYHQWIEEPSFEARFVLIAGADYMTNTRFTGTGSDSTPLAEAIARQEGSVENTYRTPNSSDAMRLTLYGDEARAVAAYEALRDGSGRLLPKPMGEFYPVSFCAGLGGRDFTCAALFDDLVIEGRARTDDEITDPGAIDHLLIDVHGLVQTGYKRYVTDQHLLRPAGPGLPLGLLAVMLLVFGPFYWRTISAPPSFPPTEATTNRL